MKKFLLLIIASTMTVFTMAIGRNDGSTKANAIDFDWDKGIEHVSGTKWYRVDLAPLYEEENPSLTLYLTNPSNAVGTSVDVSMKATVAGQEETKDYNIAARQYKTYTANASMLVRMKQTEIYLTLTSNGRIKLSAKVFEAADLDETCKDARSLAWETVATQNPSYSAWWKVSLLPIKNAADQDAKITLTNTGSKAVTLKVGQSLDCPSSGLTKRTYELAPGESVMDTVPRSMITSVQPDELYFGIENVESQISIKVEKVAQPPVPVISATDPFTVLHVTDTIEALPVGTTLYRIKVADMDSLAKYEPEFTYRNDGTTDAKVTVKMAFEVPAYGTSNTEYNLAPGEEQIVVYKKNMLEGMEGVEYIYLLTTVEGTDVNFYGRFKHVREGKACKTNIDFNWESGHSQEARTTQWYAIDVAQAREDLKDIIVRVLNQGNASATVKASMAFSCPYIDLQEVTRTLSANGDTLSRRIGYSTYAMMSDTVWIGLETSQNIRFWADTVDTKRQAVVDSACLNAVSFNWEEGVMQKADTTIWYLVDMTEVRDLAAKFPTVFVQNLSSTNAAVITAELSLECPDEIKNEKRSKTIAANSSYSKQLSRNLFENIVQDEIYLKVYSTQDISLQIRLTEEEEGASCSSAIPFNWVSGNTQAANENVWYSVDLRKVMERGNDIRLHIENRDNAACKGVAQLSYECPIVNATSVQNFSLVAKGEKAATIQNSAFETLEDSVVYVNLQGTTGLRFWADTLPLQHFDTIYADGLTLIPLQWDSLYTQTVDTAWYIIPQTEIEKVRNMDEKVKPVGHLYNLGTKSNTIKAEAAFAFPISKKMMTKSQTLKAGQHYSDTVPAGTFDQFLKKDSIILRVTRRTGSGDFQFKAELVSAFSGNSRNDALPIRMGEQYTQSPMTSMWYKINTADWKKDPNLFNKALHVTTKNAGTSDAKVKVAVYEGLLSETDMLEEYGLEDYRERTVKKGQGKSHNIPAQAVYALGDVELYVQVTTTDSLVFNSKFSTQYAPIAVDPNQANATLVVPNVDYVIPGDGQEHWYMVCFPYIRNNYKYVHAATLTYELTGKATIETTATLQDAMDCKMPIRKRTINKNGGHHKGTKPLSYFISKAAKKGLHRDFDITTFQEDFIDEQLRRYISSDSLTGYVRIKTTQDLKVRLNMPQTTGDECTNPMVFDWEHGNVNPSGADSWYHVKLDSLIIPDTCDLRLHVDNWTMDSARIAADLYFDCNDPATITKSYKQGADGKDTIDIDRDFLSQLGWADMIINYSSDKTSHIWAELIPSAPRDTLRDTIVAYVCQGGEYLDTITNILIDPVDYSMVWYDTVTFQDGVVMKDSITMFQIHPLVTPEVLSVTQMQALGVAPLLAQGMQLFTDSSNLKLTEYYRNLGTAVDTIISVDTVYWAEPVYKAGDLDIKKEKPLDLTSFYTKNQLTDTLLFVLKGGCEIVFRTEVVFPIEQYKYATKNDTVCPPAPVINPDTIAFTALVADTLGLPRQIDTIVTYIERIQPTLLTQAEVVLPPYVTNGAAIDTSFTLSSLKQQFEDQASDLTMAVVDAKWQVLNGTAWQDMPYTVLPTETNVAMKYIITTECGDLLTSENFNFTLTPSCIPTSGDTSAVACDLFTWYDTPLTISGDYTHTMTNVAGCDSIVTLHLTINNSANIDTTAVACDSFVWHGTTYTTSGDYPLSLSTEAGCDSIVTLHLTINHATTSDTTAVACDSFVWHGTTYTTSGDYLYQTTNVAGCDSTVTLHLTVNNSSTGDTTAVACDMFTWYDTPYTVSGDYTHVLTNAVGCDSTVTLHLTINNSVVATPETYDECNLFVWHGVTYTASGTYLDTLTTAAGCDSICQLNLTITTPFDTTLSLVHKFGDRLLMINRNEINAMPGWQLDSLDVEHPEYVTWYEIDPAGNERVVGTGYYYNLASGDPLPAGYTYYAVIDIPASTGAKCGAKGETERYTIPEANHIPALVPSLARPGEEIRIINLDPETQTIVRIYTAEGLMQGMYTVYGEESFTIKAADANGFYLVELMNDNLQTTLRYIVK